MPLQKLSVTGLDNENQRRRLPETINQILTHQFDDSRVQTAAEKLAGVTPINAAYPPGDVRRYGAVSDATTDSTSAIANALLVAAVYGGTVYVGDGQGYFCTANLNVPVGNGNTVDIVGSGWASGGIVFSGSSVTTGLTFAGSGYSYCGSVKNCRLRGSGSAIRGVTFTDITNGEVSRCYFSNFNGAGVAYLGTLMSVLDHTLFTACGSTTEGAVEVDASGSIASTTWKGDHVYISTGNTTVGGLIINRTYHLTILGGAIETNGIPLRIGHRSDATIGCVGGVIHGIDLENPGNGNVYMDLGGGLSGSAFINSYDIRGCNGSPSGSSPVPSAIKIARGLGVRFGPNNWGQAGALTSTYELVGTGNTGITIESHRNLSGISCPWVRVNSAQVKAASPYYDWESNSVPSGFLPRGTGSLVGSVNALTGANVSILIDATQGGFYDTVLMFNAGATTVTALTGGEAGMRISLISSNANTTLTHGPAVANQFNLTAGVNLLMVAGRIYNFMHDGTAWVQT